MLRVTIVLALLVLGIGNSRAEKSDIDQCRAVFKKPGFDCVCVCQDSWNLISARLREKSS
jgi:hypothetical protein